jgi:hypothetical protein
MANKKPLVIGPDGRPQQLQAGDTLQATVTGGEQQTLTNSNVGAVVIGTPVYLTGNDTFDKAQANSITTKEVVGLVASSPNIGAAGSGPVQLSGILTMTTAQWDAITGGSGGLIADTNYFLDPATAGKMTSVVPTTVGQYVVEIGTAFSTTELNIKTKTPMLL